MNNIRSFSVSVLTAMILMVASFSANATHNRAGEITYRKVANLLYEVKIVTYTNV